VHDPKRVTSLHHPNDGLYELRGLSLTVMPLLDNPIEQLAPSAELHDQVHEHGVLIGPFDPHHMRVLGQVVHDLNLPPNVLEVLLAQQLPLGDGLAGVLGSRGLLGTEVGRPKLSLPQLLPNKVMVSQSWGLIRQHRGRRLCCCRRLRCSALLLHCLSSLSDLDRETVSWSPFPFPSLPSLNSQAKKAMKKNYTFLCTCFSLPPNQRPTFLISLSSRTCFDCFFFFFFIVILFSGQVCC
jgi:hypothetical protein